MDLIKYPKIGAAKKQKQILFHIPPPPGRCHKIIYFTYKACYSTAEQAIVNLEPNLQIKL